MSNRVVSAASVIAVLVYTLMVLVALGAGWLDIALHQFVLLLLAGEGIREAIQAGAVRRRAGTSFERTPPKGRTR